MKLYYIKCVVERDFFRFLETERNHWNVIIG